MNLTMKPVHVTFPSIEQFRNTCHDVKHFAKMAQKPLPKITFEGTVKLHGTNSGISAYNSHTDPENFWCQSRNQILTVTNDNYGFAKFVDSQKEAVASLLKSFADKLETLLPNRVFILNIFGEWAGSGVQQGVGVSQLPKMFVVFAVGVQDTETENVDTNHRKWVWLKREDIQDVMHNYNLTNFKSIYDFQTWTHEVDFLNPKISQNYFAEQTLLVEKECPVAKAFGVSGIGEGIVFKAISTTADYLTQDHLNSLTFKCKGREHSVSKVTTIASIDIEKLNSVKELAESFVTKARLEQGIQFLRDNNLEITQKSTGKFLEWVNKDIIKEETDTITGNNFAVKDVMPQVSKMARDWYLAEWHKYNS